MAVLLLDLNNFKQVNDLLGHHAGDVLLCQVAARLRSVVQESELLFRLGGDEFVIVQSESTGTEDTLSLAERIRRILASPMLIESHCFCLTTSIGICHYPDDGNTWEELLKQADMAMYRDKRWCKLQSEVFDYELPEHEESCDLQPSGLPQLPQGEGDHQS